MAITSTGFQAPATSRVGLAPSVHDSVLLIGAEQTPLLNLIGTTNVDSITHSWIIDRMSPPDNTPQKEITGFSGGTKSTKQKNTNAVQITITEVMVSETMQRVKTYGGNELAHEVNKKAKEHSQKLEYQLFGLGLDSDPKVSVFKAPITRTETQAGQMAGLFHFAAKDTSAFSGGKRGNVFAFDASGDWSGAEQDLTWETFNEILNPIWAQGGVPKDVFVGAKLKNKINEFVKHYGYRTIDNGDKAFNGIVNKIETDFGVVNIHLHRYLSSSYGLDDVLIAADFEYIKHGLLIPTTLKDVSTDKTAAAKRYYTESTLIVLNADALTIGVGLK